MWRLHKVQEKAQHQVSVQEDAQNQGTTNNQVNGTDKEKPKPQFHPNPWANRIKVVEVEVDFIQFLITLNILRDLNSKLLYM